MLDRLFFCVPSILTARFSELGCSPSVMVHQFPLALPHKCPNISSSGGRLQLDQLRWRHALIGSIVMLGRAAALALTAVDHWRADLIMALLPVLFSSLVWPGRAFAGNRELVAPQIFSAIQLDAVASSACAWFLGDAESLPYVWAVRYRRFARG